MKPGMNDVLPCGTEVARRRHIALAQWCPVCGTDGRRVALLSLDELVEQRREAARVLRGGAG